MSVLASWRDDKSKLLGFFIALGQAISRATSTLAAPSCSIWHVRSVVLDLVDTEL
jgi:hypothetical protein